MGLQFAARGPHVTRRLYYVIRGHIKLCIYYEIPTVVRRCV